MKYFLRKALETGKVLFIDEIDRSLHPSLIKLLVNLFRDVRINTKGAQLIFNTHETALLSPPYITAIISRSL